MACRPAGAKPSSESMLGYCHLGPREQTSVKSYRNLYIFIQENAFESVVWIMAAILSRPQCIKASRMFGMICCHQLEKSRIFVGKFCHSIQMISHSSRTWRDHVPRCRTLR